jgi:hypothetical protein
VRSLNGLSLMDNNKTIDPPCFASKKPGKHQPAGDTYEYVLLVVLISNLQWIA